MSFRDQLRRELISADSVPKEAARSSQGLETETRVGGRKFVRGWEQCPSWRMR